jgi:ubiquinone/menaquinone biosynthesis C-methylase UbiE
VLLLAKGTAVRTRVQTGTVGALLAEVTPGVRPGPLLVGPLRSGVVRPHPVFAVVYSVVAAVGEQAGYGRWRARALAGARGTVLVVGLGPGHDLLHLPPEVSSVVGVEPDAAMRARAQRRAATAGVPVHLVGGVAESLPLRDASVDAALVSLVLCSVSDPAAAAEELRRVLRPSGTLHVLEHVHAPPGTALRRWQDRLDPVWSRAAGGCRLTRETADVLAEAGFDVSGLQHLRARPAPPPLSTHLTGTTTAVDPPPRT